MVVAESVPVSDVVNSEVVWGDLDFLVVFLVVVFLVDVEKKR